MLPTHCYCANFPTTRRDWYNSNKLSYIVPVTFTVGSYPEYAYWYNCT